MSNLVARGKLAKKRRKALLERELVRIVSILKKAGVKKIILFGSLATGDIGRASDIDLIIVKDTTEKFIDRLDEVYSLVEPKLSADMLVYTPEEFERLKKERSFVKRAVEEGIVLYEAESSG